MGVRKCYPGIIEDERGNTQYFEVIFVRGTAVLLILHTNTAVVIQYCCSTAVVPGTRNTQTQQAGREQMRENRTQKHRTQNIQDKKKTRSGKKSEESERQN